MLHLFLLLPRLVALLLAFFSILAVFTFMVDDPDESRAPEGSSKVTLLLLSLFTLPLTIFGSKCILILPTFTGIIPSEFNFEVLFF